MYYYLFEPGTADQERSHKKAISLINLHGITGEMTTPSDTRSLEDLISGAAEKGYNTIVAVGGDKFISTVASFLTRSDIAFGAIPIGASEKMEELLGVKTLEQAVQSLKQRKLIETGVGIISPNKVFLLDAEIKTPKPVPVVIESKTFKTEGTFTLLTIERQEYAVVKFIDESIGPSPIMKFISWLVNKRMDNPTETVLRAPFLTITTPESMPVLINDEQIATTPCKIRVASGALKLIQARSTLTT